MTSLNGSRWSAFAVKATSTGTFAGGLDGVVREGGSAPEEDGEGPIAAIGWGRSGVLFMGNPRVAVGGIESTA